MIKDLESIFIGSHANIMDAFTSLEKSNKPIITSDKWKRDEGGGGHTFVIQDGNFFDNCAVNFSSIAGKKLPKAALGKSISQSSKYGYRAMGVSVIAHPKNPFIPTSHMNIRLFCVMGINNTIKKWWIGGGYDLTPYLPFKDDCINWHKEAKENLDLYNKTFYKNFSKNCNEYFYIPHRKERRGIGGLFFDNLSNMTLEKSTNMLSSIANTYFCLLYTSDAADE